MKKYVLLLVFLIASCEKKNEIIVLQGQTMGSTYEIKFVSKKDVSIEEQYAKVDKRLQRFLKAFDKNVSNYRTDSKIVAFNNLENACMKMPPSILAMVELATMLNKHSNGKYDITVAPLMKLYGFNNEEFRVPSEEEIELVRQKVGMQYLTVNSTTKELCKERNVEIDLNSLAAGYAIDRIANDLEDYGIDSYMIQMTGEIKAKRLKTEEKKWVIAIDKPKDGKQEIYTTLEVNDFAISTSGNYRNYFVEDGEKFAHTFDATIGKPVRNSIASITVLHKSAMFADALSTMLMTMGDEAYVMVNQDKMPAMIIRYNGDDLEQSSTKEFLEMANWLKK